jgi:hypothetical protein
VIDTAVLVWGGQFGSSSRRADAPAAGRRREVLADPIRLDWAHLVEKLGSNAGEIQHRLYGERVWRGGHWKVGAADVMYRDGRLEVRASLPKVVAGRNDVVLNESGVHAALRELAQTVGEAIEHPLSLREAVPTRLDYPFQWVVPSVAAIQAHLKTVFHPKNKLRSEFVSPRGGRTVWWGQKSNYSLRFYDKVGELRAGGEDEHVVEIDWDGIGHLLERGEQPTDLDRLLRYEIQDKRSGGELRLIHENGYRSADIRAELARPLEGLQTEWLRDVDALIDDRGGNRMMSNVFASLWIAEHEEALAIVRRRQHPNVYRRYRRDAQDAALALYAWQPIIPRTAFVSADRSLWADDDLDEAA